MVPCLQSLQRMGLDAKPSGMRSLHKDSPLVRRMDRRSVLELAIKLDIEDVVECCHVPEQPLSQHS